MYGLGISYTDISAHIEDIYQISISTATIIKQFIPYFQIQKYNFVLFIKLEIL